MYLFAGFDKDTTEHVGLPTDVINFEVEHYTAYIFDTETFELLEADAKYLEDFAQNNKLYCVSISRENFLGAEVKLMELPVPITYYMLFPLSKVFCVDDEKLKFCVMRNVIHMRKKTIYDEEKGKNKQIKYYDFPCDYETFAVFRGKVGYINITDFAREFHILGVSKHSMMVWGYLITDFNGHELRYAVYTIHDDGTFKLEGASNSLEYTYKQFELAVNQERESARSEKERQEIDKCWTDFTKRVITFNLMER